MLIASVGSLSFLKFQAASLIYFYYFLQILMVSGLHFFRFFGVKLCGKLQNVWDEEILLHGKIFCGPGEIWYSLSSHKD